MARGVRAQTTSQLMITCEHQLEEALHFLIHALEDTPRKGKKPVAIHSLRVAWRLLAGGQPASVVVAGLLHDILEKTSLSQAHISRRFGAEVGRMVKATTNDMRLSSPLARYRDSLLRCQKVGRGAFMVRFADLIDNCDRLLALGDPTRLERLRAKLRLAVAVAREMGLARPMQNELTSRLRRLDARRTSHDLAAKKHPTWREGARLSPGHQRAHRRA